MLAGMEGLLIVSFLFFSREELHGWRVKKVGKAGGWRFRLLADTGQEAINEVDCISCNLMKKLEQVKDCLNMYRCMRWQDWVIS